MKAKWAIESDFPLGTQGKIYEILDQRAIGKVKPMLWYKIMNDMDETCWFPAGYFEIIDE